jgi:hypothetical protein
VTIETDLLPGAGGAAAIVSLGLPDRPEPRRDAVHRAFDDDAVQLSAG